MRFKYDSEANVAHIAIEEDMPDGSAVENLVVEHPGRGDIVLEFDIEGRLLGVEIVRLPWQQRISLSAYFAVVATNGRSCSKGVSWARLAPHAASYFLAAVIADFGHGAPRAAQASRNATARPLSRLAAVRCGC
ncbi:DUF2283 domain-containing protein [Paractinoplanes toevensis]|uniref:DUF2283 domain-containing protein n=1 Tax=Paractinoplanes toevensis TaxID=571911 RepID=A0A919W5W3_9ACTN|nr:DUF2283 domain-containing protein [Actinoplanes toevensis]GIM91923.1 hypothetical protein Ato02nite_037160 [Actinoplanes toevensis]